VTLIEAYTGAAVSPTTPSAAAPRPRSPTSTRTTPTRCWRPA